MYYAAGLPLGRGIVLVQDYTCCDVLVVLDLVAFQHRHLSPFVTNPSKRLPDVVHNLRHGRSIVRRPSAPLGLEVGPNCVFLSQLATLVVTVKQWDVYLESSQERTRVRELSYRFNSLVFFQANMLSVFHVSDIQVCKQWEIERELRLHLCGRENWVEENLSNLSIFKMRECGNLSIYFSWFIPRVGTEGKRSQGASSRCSALTLLPTGLSIASD
jgi:hypothetical protein